MVVAKVEVVVLGFLAEEPMHGYDLLERLRARSMGFWVGVGKASVYQALRRLEAAGLIAGRAQEGLEGPDRRVYRITRAGRDRLRTGLVERFAEVAPYETGAGLALGFIHLLPAADGRKAIDARVGSLRGLLDTVKAERGRAASDHGAVRGMASAMLDRQEALAKAELAWIKSFRASLARVRR
jgi:DNA-binding PadR family transcriptional regulator